MGKFTTQKWSYRCEVLLRARLVPDRAGADTQAAARVPLSRLRQLPGARDLKDAWIRARLGEDGYLAGKDAGAAAGDARAVPVVTGTTDDTVTGQMTSPARTAAQASAPGPGTAADNRAPPGRRAGLRPGRRRRGPPPGPAGQALQHPRPPPGIGYSDTIPWQIRRAVLLRDRKCAWPRYGRAAVYCDVHHLRHKEDGGETSLENLVLACRYHHDVCIHRRGWQLVLHLDGTTEARSPDGKQILHSHAPPTEHAT